MAAGPSSLSTMQLDEWPDVSWRRLIDALTDPAHVWATMPRCPSCGRCLADSDCEPDGGLCWSGVIGSCC